LFWFGLILAFLSFCYILTSAALSIGVSRLKKQMWEAPIIGESQNAADLPFVSILVPARDEERYISDCLESLVHQQYPPDRYEIVVVNDRSTDSTPQIIRSYMEEHSMIKCVTVDSNSSGLTGKQNALNEGLKLCRGDIILNTDADCIAGPFWVPRTVSCFTPQIGLTIGFSITYSRDGLGLLFSGLQSLDMLFLTDAAAGAIGINIPISCSGRNLAYRKRLLDDIGYLGMGYTITEDAALIQTVAKHTNWKIAVVYDKDAAVLTSAEESIRQFLSQRVRWVLGGRAIRSWVQIPLHTIFLFHLCLAISLLLMFFERGFVAVILFSAFSKTTLDLVRCWRVCKEFGRTDLLKLFVPYEVFMVFYSILAGLGSIFVREIRWKGELYKRGTRHIHSGEV
jgi:cellulose synthase/poly-beta-1,6-N-acetylglucosamine synthase-like glycosyltransferase